MKKISSYLYAFLLSITVVFSLFSLTVLSKNFVLKVIDKSNYINIINESTGVSKKEIKKDLNKYITNKYQKLNLKDKEYNKYINFMNIDKNITYIIYLITILLIIVTGNIFNKTKKKHDKKSILLITSIMLIIIYGLIYILFNRTFILNEIVYTFDHYILFIAVLFLMISIFSRMLSHLITEV